ncbi:Plasmodium exported protein, unknown function [Plasmodium gonderi]|uniref:Pv-fam-d protein n=1 Tax=Plasmodium gonderi TaxID=77519 RepID=A0A1Y1JHK6_PLAGO|nr:Plasmodium exported protein, unknown function [Plasmodium gonderi]GAW82006.1 Plasmodium exported protein, unknown function [Plasmodium gonderi]
MKEQSNKFFLFKIFTYNALIWTWQYYSNGVNKKIFYIYTSNGLNVLMFTLLTLIHNTTQVTTCGQSFDNEFTTNYAIDARTGRILRAGGDVDVQSKNNSIHGRLMDIVNEDDDSHFERRLKLLIEDDDFKSEFKSLMSSKKNGKKSNARKSHDNKKGKKGSKEFLYNKSSESLSENSNYSSKSTRSRSTRKYEDIDESKNSLASTKYNGNETADESANNDDDKQSSRKSSYRDDDYYDDEKSHSYYKDSDYDDQSIITAKTKKSAKGKSDILNMSYERKKDRDLISYLMKFFKKSDALYETELIKLMSTEHKDHICGGPVSRKKYSKLFAVASPVIVNIVFIIISLLMTSNVGMITSVILLLLSVLYVSRKSRKCRRMVSNYGSFNDMKSVEYYFD